MMPVGSDETADGLWNKNGRDNVFRIVTHDDQKRTENRSIHHPQKAVDKLHDQGRYGQTCIFQISVFLPSKDRNLLCADYRWIPPEMGNSQQFFRNFDCDFLESFWYFIPTVMTIRSFGTFKWNSGFPFGKRIFWSWKKRPTPLVSHLVSQMRKGSAYFLATLCFYRVYWELGTEGRNRTGMELPPLDFESSASTYFTTPAYFWDYNGRDMLRQGWIPATQE